jgi:hypothetical protein
MKKSFIAYFSGYPDGMAIKIHLSATYSALKVFLFSRWLVK